MDPCPRPGADRPVLPRRCGDLGYGSVGARTTDGVSAERRLAVSPEARPLVEDQTALAGQSESAHPGRRRRILDHRGGGQLVGQLAHARHAVRRLEPDPDANYLRCENPWHPVVLGCWPSAAGSWLQRGDLAARQGLNLATESAKAVRAKSRSAAAMIGQCDPPRIIHP